MLPGFLRLAVYIAPRGEIDNLPMSSECVEIVRVRRGVLLEIWLRCGCVEDLLRSLESLLSYGYIAFVAGLDGVVFEGVPSSMNDLVSLASKTPLIESGVSVEAEILRNVDLRVLIDYMARVEIDFRSRVLRGVVSRSVSAGLFFDMGLRLLRPWRAPP